MAVDDPLLPAAPHLTGPGARPVVEAAVRATGGRLGRLRPRQVLYRPGRELVVRYDATVEWGNRGPVEETLLAGTTPDGPPPGTLPLEAGDLAVGVWRYPFDPALPGLDAAVRSGGAAALLGVTDGPVALEVRTYRPTRRAVIRAWWSGGEAYLKVLPPDEAAALVAVHERLGAAGLPVAPVVGVDMATGVVVLGALGPEVLRARLLEGQPPWPDGTSILALLDRMAAVAVPVAAHRRSPPLAAAAGHARMLATVLPSEAGRIEELRARFDIARAATAPGQQRTVHGDLHDGQLTTDDEGRITGLLDVDGVGPGDRVDDLANLIGHLTSLACSAGTAGAAVRRYAADLHRDVARQVGAVELDHRVAAVLLGLATGPFRVQERGWRREVRRRIALSERWMSTHERTLSRAS